MVTHLGSWPTLRGRSRGWTEVRLSAVMAAVARRMDRASMPRAIVSHGSPRAPSVNTAAMAAPVTAARESNHRL